MVHRTEGSLAKAHTWGQLHENRSGARRPQEAVAVVAQPVTMADGGRAGMAAVGMERLSRYFGGRIHKACKWEKGVEGSRELTVCGMTPRRMQVPQSEAGPWGEADSPWGRSGARLQASEFGACGASWSLKGLKLPLFK